MPSAPCSTTSNPAKARTTPTTWPSARRGTTCRRCSPTAQLSIDAIALNSKLDAQASALSATVVVKDLQGGETRIKAPAAVPVPNRQAAQRANDPGLQLYKERQYAQAEAQSPRRSSCGRTSRWRRTSSASSRAVAYRNPGDAYARANQGDKAKAAFKTCLELAPSGSGADYARQQLQQL